MEHVITQFDATQGKVLVDLKLPDGSTDTQWVDVTLTRTEKVLDEQGQPLIDRMTVVFGPKDEAGKRPIIEQENEYRLRTRASTKEEIEQEIEAYVARWLQETEAKKINDATAIIPDFLKDLTPPPTPPTT